jgi:phospholipase/carboxylesterase
MTDERRLVFDFPLYYDVNLPGPAPRPLLIALHGYGSNKSSMMKLARKIAPEAFAVATLQGPHQHIVEPEVRGAPLLYGFGWLTNFRPEESIALHHRAVSEIIAGLVAQGAADPKMVFLLGFSQSVALNFRFAFTHPEMLAGVVGLCGGIPGDWETPGKYRPASFPIFYAGGELDEFYPPAKIRENAEKLKRLALSVEVRLFDAGHEVPASAIPVIREWLTSQV